MPRANVVQTNFTSGEISPLMYGRVDVTKYFNGARKLLNMIVLPQGGAFRRPGTQYMGGTKSNGYARFRKFIVSETQAFNLEFGNLYVRFWKNTGQITSGGNPVEVTSPYLAADIPYLCFAQSADVLYITHPSYPTYKLSHFSDTSWTLTQVSFNDGPYLDVDSSTNRINVLVTSDTVTIRANASGDTVAIASSAIFSASSVGKYLEYYITTRPSDGNKIYGLALVTAYTSTTQVTVTLQTNVILPTTTGTWPTITFTTGVVTSSIKMFGAGSVGKYIRLTGSQAWYLITSFTDAYHVAATAATLVTYNPASVTVSILTTGFASGDVGKYVQYQVDGTWRIANILSVTNISTVVAKIVDAIVLPDSGTKITFNTNNGINTMVADHTGIFGPGDIGKFVRSTSTGAGTWGRITAYTDSATVTVVAVTMVSGITYPSITLTLLDDRVITVTATSYDEIFNVADVGNVIRVRFGSQWRNILVTAVASGTLATGTLSDFMVFDPMNANNPYNNGYADAYRLGAWSVANGFPAVCGFHYGRLWFGRTAIQPTTLWSSKTDDYENMEPTAADGSVLDDNAITVTIATGEINPIEWIMSGPVMLIGTQGAEFQLKANSINQAISPTNVVIVPQTSYGTSQPKENVIRVGSQTLFIQQGGLKLREMSYDFNIDAFQSKDISIISEHLLRISTASASDGNPLTANFGITSMDIGHNPLSIGWMVRSDGKVIGVTYDREQDVIAFHLHELGGSGVVESVSVIPNSAIGSDDVWFIVKRTVNSTTVRYVEKFTILSTFSRSVVPYYVDCYTRSTTTGDVAQLAGLNYLLYQNVDVIVDGLYVYTQGVGVLNPPTNTLYGVTLKYSVVTDVVVGLSCPCITGLLDPEGGSPQGTSQGKMKRVVGTTVRVENSPHPKIASAPGVTDIRETVTSVDEPTSSDYKRMIPAPTIHAVGTTTPYPSPGTAPTFYTGDIQATTDDAFNNGGRVSIVQDEPYPLKIVAVMHKLNTNE